MSLADLFIKDLDCVLARLLLREWSWLLGERSVRPVAMTAFGDWFLEDKESGVIYFLDAGMGTLAEAAPSREAMRRAATRPANQQSWLLKGQHRLLRQRGLRLRPGECFSWRVAPAAGGDVDVDNIEVAPIELHQFVHSHLTRRLVGLPAGTQVSERVIQEALESAERAHDELLGDDEVTPPLSGAPLVGLLAGLGLVLSVAWLVY